ncbi:hypothetical protein ON058_02860 [Demequina sp. B12]|uniref:hypothetical protein n=1 Tax=Demequina sp. B12 TaxID=2992757 RepID=UPI00237BD845|nr:hypothetical protein [Demequina sp. B12]MDE0572351.1 hypothetical protein [Demequina sp. B12]
MVDNSRPEVLYFKSASASVREIVLGLIALGGAALIGFYPSSDSGWVTFFTGLLAVLVALFGVGKIWSAIYKLTERGKLALGVSPDGLKVSRSVELPWSDIDHIRVFCEFQSVSITQQLANFFIRSVDLRLIIVTKQKPGENTSEFERTHIAAWERDLRGRTSAFYELARVTYAEATRHGVPMSAATQQRAGVAEAIGIPLHEPSAGPR